MASFREHDQSMITRQVMCIIERCTDGTLNTRFPIITYNPLILEQLHALSREMRVWEDAQREQLLDSINPLLTEAIGRQITDIDAIANQFRNAVTNVYWTMGIDADLVPEASHHNTWQYKSGIYYLPPFSKIIRGFQVTREVVEEFRGKLEEPAFKELLSDCLLAEGTKPYLLKVLDEYEQAFYSYVDRAKRICPTLFEYKSFCRNFTAAYGDAELDYVITPGNQCIVESIEEYYWACILEQLYNVYEMRKNVVAYSHRKLGWGNSTQRIVLDPGCDLQLLQETNFGYGRVRCFRSTLSYRGVRAINASFLIFFEGSGKVGFSNSTFNYEVDEESFRTCFNDAVRLYSELRDMGEVRFVDKYFRKSLENLSRLLAIVAKTDTFLTITTLESFNALTSGSENMLIPDEGFANISFELSDKEETASNSVAESILEEVKATGFDSCSTSPSIQPMVDQLLEPYESAALQYAIKADLVRNHITQKLASSIPSSFDIDGLVKKLVPTDDGIFVKKYEGYSLINMRVKRATSVLEPIDRLNEIAALTKFESIIDSIQFTCQQISGQAQYYIAREIAPELVKRDADRDYIKKQLDVVTVEIEKAKYRGDTSWLVCQSQKLQSQLKETNEAIARLQQQKSGFESYIRKVKELQAPRNGGTH